ncbi:uncharacterized protein MONBRDRAFT_24220, partial [Monosiga brevicollis MX1]
MEQAKVAFGILDAWCRNDAIPMHARQLVRDELFELVFSDQMTSDKGTVARVPYAVQAAGKASRKANELQRQTERNGMLEAEARAIYEQLEKENVYVYAILFACFPFCYRGSQCNRHRSLREIVVSRDSALQQAAADRAEMEAKVKCSAIRARKIKIWLALLAHHGSTLCPMRLWDQIAHLADQAAIHGRSSQVLIAGQQIPHTPTADPRRALTKRNLARYIQKNTALLDDSCLQLKQQRDVSIAAYVSALRQPHRRPGFDKEQAALRSELDHLRNKLQQLSTSSRQYERLATQEAQKNADQRIVSQFYPTSVKPVAPLATHGRIPPEMADNGWMMRLQTRTLPERAPNANCLGPADVEFLARNFIELQVAIVDEARLSPKVLSCWPIFDRWLPPARPTSQAYFSFIDDLLGHADAAAIVLNDSLQGILNLTETTAEVGFLRAVVQGHRGFCSMLFAEMETKAEELDELLLEYTSFCGSASTEQSICCYLYKLATNYKSCMHRSLMARLDPDVAVTREMCRSILQEHCAEASLPFLDYLLERTHKDLAFREISRDIAVDVLSAAFLVHRRDVLQEELREYMAGIPPHQRLINKRQRITMVTKHALCSCAYSDNVRLKQRWPAVLFWHKDQPDSFDDIV